VCLILCAHVMCVCVCVCVCVYVCVCVCVFVCVTENEPLISVHPAFLKCLFTVTWMPCLRHSCSYARMNAWNAWNDVARTARHSFSTSYRERSTNTCFANQHKPFRLQQHKTRRRTIDVSGRWMNGATMNTKTNDEMIDEMKQNACA
jgi:hypothetical protein